MAEYPTILTILFAVLVGSFGGSVGSFFIYRATIKQIAASLEQVKMTVDASLKQVKMTVLSGSRQEWINRLRSCVAELQGISMTLADTQEALDPILERVTTLKFKIELLLNPKESDHTEMVTLVNQLVSCSLAQTAARHRGADRQEIKTHIDKTAALQTELTETTQSVLKREWEQVKQGE